jgi:hypothetical protein
MNGEISSETKGEKLTEYIDRLETALVVAGLVVVSGLLVEDGPELWRSILTKTWPALAVIGGSLVTLGVLAEVVLAFVLARIARRIDADTECHQRINASDRPKMMIATMIHPLERR